MQLILSILLYLNIISSPGTYMQSDIDNDVIQNQPAINAVQADPVMLNTVIANFQNDVLGITILDDGQLK